jgi:ribosomal protein L18
MRKVPETVCCSRCGDEIGAEELMQSLDRLCVFCSNMHLEAQQITQSQRHKAHKASLHSVAVSQQ